MYSIIFPRLFLAPVVHREAAFPLEETHEEIPRVVAAEEGNVGDRRRAGPEQFAGLPKAQVEDVLVEGPSSWRKMRSARRREHPIAAAMSSVRSFDSKACPEM